MKFTLREMFMLVVIVALTLGWWRSSLLAQKTANEIRAERYANSYHIWDVGRAWAKEVNRDLTIETPDGIIHVDPIGGVRNWSHPGEKSPVDVEYSPLPK
jgi:hypothetical protein